VAKPGRKPVDVDPEQVEKLAALGCTNLEIASFFNCSDRTIRDKFSENVAKGKEQGKIRLRQLQWQSAQKGNVTMQIWLGKNILGQKDGSTLDVPPGKRLIIEDND
jgi:hypothetical protein